MKRVDLYPNPNNGSFTLASMDNTPIEKVSVYSLQGKLIIEKENIGKAKYVLQGNFEKGTYVTVIHTLDGAVHRKKMMVQ